MRILKRLLLALLSIVILIIVSLVVYGFYIEPKYKGELGLKNIADETTVYFDEFGIPHIYANSQKDAMVALGYVHAQDRLWQMELMRRIAPGRLSEILGNKLVKTDKLFVALGIDEASEAAVAAADKNSEHYKLALAYIDGINQFMDEGQAPVEFNLAGVKKQHFTIKDVYNIFGYMSFSFAMAQKTDPLLTSLRDTLGMEYMKDLGIDGSLNTTRLKSYKQQQDYMEMSKSIAALIDASPVPPFVGSNSWVVGPQKTKNGKVIFANDPHIGFSQPATWYEAHIVAPDYEMYGYYLAGTPFPLLGHNRNYAYGLTMFENDDIDLFSENENPSNGDQYQTPQGWTDYSIKEKTIIVKDSSNVKLRIKTSKHGPVMNGILDGLQYKKPVSLSWVYTQQPLKILEAVYGISHAANIEDFHQKVGLIAAPGLNVMYGDSSNNIAWFASGKLYKLDPSVNPNFILDGANGIDDKKEFIDFSKNPSAVNPSWNYVYSANNQPEAIDGYLYPGYYLPEDRAKRIDQLLSVKNNWDKESISKMITDNVSAIAPDVVKVFLDEVSPQKLSPNGKQALLILKSWNGSNGYKDVAPTIYNKCIARFLANTFKDEMGEERFMLFNNTHLLKQVIAPLIKNRQSVWWDDSRTPQKETRTDILEKSFREAVAALEKQLGPDIDSWTWNRVHTVEHQHPFGTIAALRPYFNVGPFEIDGSNEVINNTFFGFSKDGEYKVKGGSSTRRVIDFSDIENSLSILPTGQSGNFLSTHYNDQAEMYNAGKFRKMKLNKDEIIKTSTKLVFKSKVGESPK